MNAATMPHSPDSVQPKAPPRLVFVRQQFSPFGGGELILDRMIGALAARGLKIALLARAWTERDDVEFIECDPPRFPRFLRERRFARAACDRLAHEAAAIVQAHERIPCCDIFRAGDGVHAAYLAARGRGMGPLARAAQALSPFHRNIVALERTLFASPRLKAVIVNSAMVADEIVRYYAYPRECIHLIPNGIDLERFSPAAGAKHRAEVRRRLGVAADRPVALFLGSGYGRKGLGSAIEAMARSKSDAELWVIGHDRRPTIYAAQAARAGLADRFRLIGPVRDPLPYYAAADILVLPVIYDPFPSTVLESLACGLPVVTSTGCGGRDAVAQLDSALVRDTFDVEGLAHAIDRAFALAAKPATMYAARAVASEYSVDKMIERLLALYETLIKSRGSA
jgi:UDP-glucose:(heptosyl)LPS alpha-1,3-glucosyltransferase